MPTQSVAHSAAFDHQVQRQGSQVRDAIRIKTMRGVWQLREYPKDGGAGKFTEGNVTFQGSTLEARGLASPSPSPSP